MKSEKLTGEKLMQNLTDLRPHSVSRVPDKTPITVGSLFATDGAWNRKYIAVEGKNVKFKRQAVRFYSGGRFHDFWATSKTEVKLKYLGSYFATGDAKPAKRDAYKIIEIYTDRKGKRYSPDPQVQVRMNCL